jgi:uncharacterized protein YndB with AHSA1/START domain
MSAVKSGPEVKSTTSDREIVTTRLYDAPRELVFSAWADPLRISQWWGPRGFKTTTHSMDFRPDGEWRFVMHGPDGTDYKNRIVYVEINRPEKIAYRHGGEDEHAYVQFTSTVTFTEEQGKTRVTLRALFETAEARNFVAEKHGAVEGAKQTLERLAEDVSSADADDSEFILSRAYDAPRSLVFKAYTEAERLAQWWGPKGCNTRVAKLDLRPGGMFLYAMDFGGDEMWGKFVYREIAAPGRLVFVSSFSDPQGNTTKAPFFDLWPLEVLNTVIFEEHQGKTTITLRSRPINATQEERAKFRSEHKGMQQGYAGTLDHLAEYLSKEKA